MSFINTSVESSLSLSQIPDKIGLVTALHACDTATDDAITFALQKKAEYVMLIPCCQAEVASQLRANKKFLQNEKQIELLRHPLHTREFGSHLTNVLRCLRLEAAGYSVTVTELIGFEHSMKNELIIGEYTGRKNQKSHDRAEALLSEYKIKELGPRFLD